MTASDQTAQERIEQCQGLVRSLASRIHRKLPPHVDLDDLIAYGQVGLAEAARDFDPARGSQFSTYAYYRIRGSVYDGLSKMTWLSRSQYKKVRDDQLSNEVLGEQAKQQEESSEKPGAEADMRWFRDLSQALAVVYLSTGTEKRGEAKEAALADASTPTPAAVAMGREIHEKLHELIDALPAEAGTLIRATYFEGLTLQEAGKRLGISKSWASRLHAKTLQRLARSLKLLGVSSN